MRVHRVVLVALLPPLGLALRLFPGGGGGGGVIQPPAGPQEGLGGTEAGAAAASNPAPGRAALERSLARFAASLWTPREHALCRSNTLEVSLDPPAGSLARAVVRRRPWRTYGEVQVVRGAPGCSPLIGIVPQPPGGREGRAEEVRGMFFGGMDGRLSSGEALLKAHWGPPVLPGSRVGVYWRVNVRRGGLDVFFSRDRRSLGRGFRVALGARPDCDSVLFFETALLAVVADCPVVVRLAPDATRPLYPALRRTDAAGDGRGAGATRGAAGAARGAAGGGAGGAAGGGGGAGVVRPKATQGGSSPGFSEARDDAAGSFAVSGGPAACRAESATALRGLWEILAVTDSSQGAVRGRHPVIIEECAEDASGANSASTIFSSVPSSEQGGGARRCSGSACPGAGGRPHRCLTLTMEIFHRLTASLRTVGRQWALSEFREVPGSSGEELVARQQQQMAEAEAYLMHGFEVEVAMILQRGRRFTVAHLGRYGRQLTVTAATSQGPRQVVLRQQLEVDPGQWTSARLITEGVS